MFANRNRLGVLTASVVLASSVVTAGPVGAQSQGDTPTTFECQPGFYQVIAGQLAELDPAGDAYEPIGAQEPSYNAMGYRIADGLLYGIRNSQLIQIDADGVVRTIADLPFSNSYTGDFDDEGLLHVSRGGSDWHTVDVDTGEATSIPQLSGAVGVADITNVYGKFYGVSSGGDLVRFDPDGLTVTVVGAVSGLPRGNAFGAAWSTVGGNLYIGRNSGEIYQVTGYSGNTPAATQVASAQSTNSNDGGSCSLAPAPAGIVDVDGPTPETEPSTPQAREAAEQYEEQGETTYTFPSSGTPDGPSCATGIDEDRAPRLAVSAQDVSSPTVVYASAPAPQLNDFDVLSGLWVQGNDALEQTHDCGYDYTALLRSEPLVDYRWEAAVSATAGQNRGGAIINQSSPHARSGATIIDIAEGPGAGQNDARNILRWGAYDDRGYYQMLGSAPLSSAGQSVEFVVEVHGTDVEVWVDGEQLTSFSAPNAGGHVGLVTSRAAAAFNDLQLTALPTDANEAK